MLLDIHIRLSQSKDIADNVGERLQTSFYTCRWTRFLSYTRPISLALRHTKGFPLPVTRNAVISLDFPLPVVSCGTCLVGGMKWNRRRQDAYRHTTIYMCVCVFYTLFLSTLPSVCVSGMAFSACVSLERNPLLIQKLRDPVWRKYGKTGKSSWLGNRNEFSSTCAQKCLVGCRQKRLAVGCNVAVRLDRYPLTFPPLTT